MIKQVIVLRTDLGMRKGKMAAQASHASMKVFLDRKLASPDLANPLVLAIPLTEEMSVWIYGTFTKIVLGVESESDLLKAYEAARAAGIPAALIQDIGATEFHGVPTYTAVAIGPDEADKIDLITGSTGLVKTKLL